MSAGRQFVVTLHLGEHHGQREVEGSGEQVESTSMSHAHEDVSRVRPTGQPEELVVEGHAALGALASVALDGRELGADEAVKVLPKGIRFD